MAEAGTKITTQTAFHVGRVEKKSIPRSSFRKAEYSKIFKEQGLFLPDIISIKNSILNLQKDTQLNSLLTPPLQERFRQLRDNLAKETDPNHIKYLIKNESGRDKTDDTRLVEQLLMRTVNLDLNEAFYPKDIQQLALLFVIASDETLPRDTIGSITINAISSSLVENVISPQEENTSSLTPENLQERLHIFIESRKLYTDLLNFQDFNEQIFNAIVRSVITGSCATAISYYTINQLLQTHFNGEYTVSFPPEAWIDTDLKADLIIHDTQRIVGFIQSQAFIDQQGYKQPREAIPQLAYTYIDQETDTEQREDIIVIKNTLSLGQQTLANTYIFSALAQEEQVQRGKNPLLIVFDENTIHAKFTQVSSLSKKNDRSIDILQGILRQPAGQERLPRVPAQDHFDIPLSILHTLMKNKRTRENLRLFFNPLVIFSSIDEYPGIRSNPNDLSIAEIYFGNVARMLRQPPDRVLGNPKK